MNGQQTDYKRCLRKFQKLEAIQDLKTKFRSSAM